MRKAFVFIAGFCIVTFLGCGALQRKLLYFPTHHTQANGLTHWKPEGTLIGYSREVPSPRNIWLMLHGNAGQAADRAYAIPCFSPQDSVFILEYPGYGVRPGKPSKASLDTAAAQAYQHLRSSFPQIPVCVFAESIGSGPACALAQQPKPPDKVVLVVPFDKLKQVAADHARFLPVGLLLGPTWDNSRSLAGYHGPVDIFAAEHDTVIPPKHAKALADHVPSARFHTIPGGHNDWSNTGRVVIRNP